MAIITVEMEISSTPEVSLADIRAAFLDVHPKPSAEENPELAALSDTEWFGYVVKAWTNVQINKGRKRIAGRNAVAAVEHIDFVE